MLEYARARLLAHLDYSHRIVVPLHLGASAGERGGGGEREEGVYNASRGAERKRDRQDGLILSRGVSGQVPRSAQEENRTFRVSTNNAQRSREVRK